MASIKVRLSQRSAVADEVWSFVFQVESPEGLTFRPGQFLSLNVGQDEKGHQVRRSYSLASPPGRIPEFSFLIKLNGGGPGSRFFKDVREGALIDMTGP